MASPPHFTSARVISDPKYDNKSFGTKQLQRDRSNGSGEKYDRMAFHCSRKRRETDGIEKHERRQTEKRKRENASVWAGGKGRGNNQREALKKKKKEKKRAVHPVRV